MFQPFLRPLSSSLMAAFLAGVLAVSITGCASDAPARESATLARYEAVATQYVEVQGTKVAYRRYGRTGGVPLVLLMRFRGTMDHWDPVLLDALAEQREVVVFDSTGVGATDGTVPATLLEVAAFAGAVIDCLGYKQVDLLGWSMGGMIAQQLTLDRPSLVRRLVLAATGPGATDVPVPPAKVWQTAAKPVNDIEDFLYLFFTESKESRAAGLASLSRLDQRLKASNSVVKLESWRRQAAMIGAWSAGKGAAYSRLAEVKAPILVANGNQDVMISSLSSYLIATKASNAELILYPDAGHGFLFQYPKRFAADVNAFLNR